MRFGPLPPSFNNTYSLAFDGVDDFVNSGASTLSGETALSISAWVYPTSYGDATAPSFVSTDAASPRAFYLGLFNGTNFRFSLSTNGTALTSLDTAAGTVDLNVWQHILVTWDQVNLKLYKNGVLLKTVATTFASNGTFTTTNDLLIGARRSSAGFFEGNIDEVAVFNSVVDIADVWDGTGEATDLSSISGLTNWYRNGDNGTWKSPQWLIPNNDNKTKFSNYSFEYDGVYDFIDTGAIDLGETNTISFWFKNNSANTGNGVIGDADNHVVYFQTVNLFYYPVGSITGRKAFSSSNIASAMADTTNWHNLIFIRKAPTNGTNGYNDLACYLDGNLEGTFADVYTANINLIPVYIGKSGLVSSNTYDGLIDEVSYYDNDQTANVTSIYNSGVPNDISSLSPVGYWRSENSTFNTNWTVTDNGSGGNNGTSANMTIDDRVGDAPNSTSNALSYNMDEADRETDVPS